MRVKWYLIVGLICISLVTNDAELFSCAYWPFVYLSGEMSSYPLSILKLNYLPFYWVVEVLYSQYSSLVRYRICQCFLPFCGLSFHFLDDVLWSTKVFNFDRVRFIHFSLSSTPSPAFIVSRFFDDGHSDRFEMISHRGFDLHFPGD